MANEHYDVEYVWPCGKVCYDSGWSTLRGAKKRLQAITTTRGVYTRIVRVRDGKREVVHDAR